MLALYRAGRQADALRAFQKARARLAEMGIEPSSELQEILERSSSLNLDTRAPRTGIPSVPRAENETRGKCNRGRRIEELVDSHPFVTVTRVGGVGKTRLAIELGNRVQDQVPDGVFFVDLSSVEREQQVVREISR